MELPDEKISASGDMEFIPDKDKAGPGFIKIAGKWYHKKCTIQLLKQRLPILQWMPQYTLQAAFRDFLAGFTVALTAIPQGIAYGAVAGVPIEYGLYTAFAGPLVYALFGSVRQVTVGPTAVMAIMTQAYTIKGGAPYAIMLSFLAGCFEFLAGLLNLGWIMDFISGPVVSGFCSAAAVTVIASQLKSMLGLTFPGSSFSQVVSGIYFHWNEVSLWDSLLGLAFIVFLLGLKNITLVKKWCSTSRCLLNPCVHTALWFVSTCRNALAVILGCVIAYCLDRYGYQPFRLTGEIKSGIPSFQLPPFGFYKPSSNASYGELGEWVPFTEIVSDLGAGLAMVPIIAILEQVAIAKAFSNGKKTDSTQEMIAVGLGSMFCSFFGCIPLTASFSRSSVLSASGGKTQFANFFNGCVVLIALSFLMPTFYYIPKSVLAAVIIVAVYCMVEIEEIKPMWKGRRIELVPFATSFFCCLLINIEYGILIGTQTHLMLLVYEATRSTSALTTFKNEQDEWIVVKADRSLYFPAVERFRHALTKVPTHSHSNSMLNRTIVIDMARVDRIDHTSLKMLKSMLAAWDKRGENYVFCNVSPYVEKLLQSILPDGVTVLDSSEINVPSEGLNSDDSLLILSTNQLSITPSVDEVLSS